MSNVLVNINLNLVAFKVTRKVGENRPIKGKYIILVTLQTYTTGYPSVINPHLPSGPVHPYQLDESISSIRGVWCTFSFFIIFRIDFPLANSEDPDQTPPSAASDLGMHYLPVSQKLDARLIWVHVLCVCVCVCFFFRIIFQLKTSLTFKCLIEHLLADFSYSRPLDTYL